MELLDFCWLVWYTVALTYVGARCLKIAAILDELEASRVRDTVLRYNNSVKEDT
tara:strand:- start:1026 stop:1187 length:162 start_codon:yes stop_codon:yes gene_type:complete